MRMFNNTYVYLSLNSNLVRLKDKIIIILKENLLDKERRNQLQSYRFVPWNKVHVNKNNVKKFKSFFLKKYVYSI